MLFKKILFLLLCSISISAYGQLKRKALFLGNSYTSYNNLAYMTAGIANSAGDTLTYDTNTIGGLTLAGHFTDSTSTAKIRSGGWSYVVLQDQSQLPSFEQYDGSAGANLCMLNAAYNPCARTLFYMTWGRRDGDASNCAAWPPVCTYNGMDSMLRMRYMEMAMQNKAEVSPVGVAWKYCREHFPGIELYSADGSHPSLAGSYVAACCFYTMIFKKDPTLATYNSSLAPATAAIIRSIAKTVVFDNLAAWSFIDADPHTDFTFTNSSDPREISFSNNSTNAESYLWQFGDGTTSTDTNPVHTYASDGNYTVILTASNCDLSEMKQQSKQMTIDLNPVIHATGIMVYPNPTTGFFTVKLPPSSVGMSYRIIDVLGRVIQKGKLDREVNDFNLRALAPGTYILQTGSVKKKIVKY